MPSTNSILIIDDEINLRRSLALILQRAGYSVTMAGNSREARQYLGAGAYDLVFLDIKMPDTDGIELLSEIHRTYPEMPVFILTAHGTLDSAINAVRRGARDYLLKPIDPEQILMRVGEILAESDQLKRRREIVGEMRGLLTELNRLEKKHDQPVDEEEILPVVDAARILRRGPFVLDLHARYVTFNDKPVALSPTAFDYLVTLVRHSPNSVSYETLVIESQGYKTSLIEAREIARWRIHELRKALEPDTRNPANIITVRGVGYRLVS